jgi:hypothetical protein
MHPAKAYREGAQPVTVIDLDRGHPAADTPPARPPVRVYRPAGLLLALALVLALGGATPVTATLWRALGHIPLTSGDLYAVDRGRVLTLENPLQKSVLSAWRPDPLVRVWSVDLDLGAEPDPAESLSGLGMTPDGDRLLVRTHDYRTLAVDLRSGRKLWEAPAPVQPAGPGVGMSRTEVYPPDSQTDNDGSGGRIYLSPTGRQHHEPPLSTDTSGIDLATGRTLWTRHDTGSITVDTAGPRLVVVAGDRLQLLNPQNGHILTERTAPKVTSMEAIDNLVLIGEGEQTVAYDSVTLEPHWRSPTGPAGDLSSAICYGILCRNGPKGREVVDPATGRAAWPATRNTTLRRSGPVVLEMEAMSQRPLRLLDPATGEVRATLTDWQMVTYFGPILLSRVEPGGKNLSFAVVQDTEIQPLGYATMTAPECRAGTGVVACRIGTGLEIFAFPEL